MSENSATEIIVGDFRITLVRAGSYWWDGGAMFGVVPKTLWSKTQPADHLNRIEAGFNCYVVEDGRNRILVETGGGVRHDSRACERMNMPDPPHLTELLAARGFAPESFNIVVNTHLHWDHVGGNTIGDDTNAVPAFPNAAYITQQGELEHARSRYVRDSVSYRPVNYEPLLNRAVLRLIQGNSEISPGIHLEVAKGHNRDMMIVRVESHNESWCHLADLVMYAAQTPPTWVSAFDLYPMDTIENKLRIQTRAAEGNWWCSFAHDPGIAFAKIESNLGKWEARQCKP